MKKQVQRKREPQATDRHAKIHTADSNTSLYSYNHREKRVEGVAETALNKQRVRRRMSETMRRGDEGKKTKSIWDLLGRGHKRMSARKRVSKSEFGSQGTITRPRRKM